MRKRSTASTSKASGVSLMAALRRSRRMARRAASTGWATVDGLRLADNIAILRPSSEGRDAVTASNSVSVSPTSGPRSRAPKASVSLGSANVRTSARKS